MALAGPPDRNTPSEENMALSNYAKAVSCLRLIFTIRVSYKPATVYLGAIVMLIDVSVGGVDMYVM